MKILVVGDSHGRRPRIHFKDFDAIICVGDVCYDRKMSKHYRGWFSYMKKNDRIDFKDYLKMKSVTKKMEREYDKFSLKGGRKILEYLNSFGKPVYFVPGNWDQSYGETNVDEDDENPYRRIKSLYDIYLADRTNPKLIRGLKNIKDCQYQLHTFGEINILGYGLSSAPENPRLRKKGKKISGKQYERLKKHYGKIHEKLKKEYQKRNKKLPTIFLTHNVPYNTKIDRILNKGSSMYKKHWGSTVAREFCQKYKPILCVGGHMHEHFGKDKIGKTAVMNAGYGRDANTLIEIRDGKLKKLSFHK
ncbi:MAG: metallophosphoesterase [Nanoarchaeota archaeon]|nr:metallophosphoesterase [Nanoarchaeota archaeon]